MYNPKIKFFFIILSAGLILSCHNLPVAEISNFSENTKILKIYSEAIKSGKNGEEIKLDNSVILPPSYSCSGKRFPVLYYLHGYGGSAYEIAGFEKAIQAWFSSNTELEFIIVGVSGSGKDGAFFYTNSYEVGNWEDFFIQELIPIIDREFRTVKEPKARSLCGFSMGGYGALELGLKHPEIFQSLFSLSPGAFDETGLKDAFATWNAAFINSYSNAFAQSRGKPAFDGSTEDNELIGLWEGGFGNWDQKIEAYSKKEIKLAGIKLYYGECDGYAWIPRGTRYVSEIMDRYNIAHEIGTHPGGHTITAEIVTQQILPFAAGYFEY